MTFSVPQAKEMREQWQSAKAVYEAGVELRFRWKLSEVEKMWDGDFNARKLKDVEYFWLLMGFRMVLKRETKLLL